MYSIINNRQIVWPFVGDIVNLNAVSSRTIIFATMTVLLLSFLVIVPAENRAVDVDTSRHWIQPGPDPLYFNHVDLDGDGDLDVMFEEHSNKTLAVMLNNGDMEYSHLDWFEVHADIRYLTHADLDGDKDQDALFAMTDHSGPDDVYIISMLFNDGEGNMTGQINVSSSLHHRRVVHAFDADGDGDNDIITSNDEETNVTVLYNDGSTNFTNGTKIRVDRPTYRFTYGDLDNDGDIDIVWPSQQEGLEILHNNGTGGYTRAQYFTPYDDYSERHVALGDYDNDGDLDLLYEEADVKDVFLYDNVGNGTFVHSKTFTSDEDSPGLAFADVTGDGWLDIIHAKEQSKQIVIIMNIGNGEFSPSGGMQRITVSGKPLMLDTFDCDGDNDTDIFYHDYYDVNEGMNYLINHNNGWFGAQEPYDLWDDPEDGSPGALRMGDIDGDGDLDIVYPNGNNREFDALINYRDGSYRLEQGILDYYTVVGRTVHDFELLDMDQDGDLDIVTITLFHSSSPSTRFHTFFNDGSGSFPTNSYGGLDRFIGSYKMGDVDADGYPDIVATGSGTNFVMIWANDQTGVLSTDKSTGAISSGVYGAALADMDGDGYQDLIYSLWNTKEVYLAINNGAGGFATGRRISTDDCACYGIEDVDNDGDLDYIMVYESSTTHIPSILKVWKNNGNGYPISWSNHTMGSRPWFEIECADLDGDGFTDIFPYMMTQGHFHFFVNNGQGGFATKKSPTIADEVKSPELGDIDKDGDIDIVFLDWSTKLLYVQPNLGDLDFSYDTDGDYVQDYADEFPNDPTEWLDMDGDGVGYNSDDLPWNKWEFRDTDGDGYGDQFEDEFPFNPGEWKDSDGDGWGDNSDAFPLDNREWLDSDNDTVGNNADFLPYDPTQTTDTDGDGRGDNESGTNGDAFPLDSLEWTDTDDDDVGDNSDDFKTDPSASLDTDSDGFPDEWNTGKSEVDSTTGLTLDAFPLNPLEWADSDSDGVGDNSDDLPNNPTQWKDSDGDGFGDNLNGTNADRFPFDPTEWFDSDGDGIGDNADAFKDNATESSDIDGDGWGDNIDAFPNNPTEWMDSDGDGKGDNSDDLPLDPDEWKDTDGDGVGDNSDDFPADASEDTDTDGDGYGDNSDAFPANPLEWVDFDGDGIGDNSDNDDDGDNYTDDMEIRLGTNPYLASSFPSDYDGDGIPDGEDDDDDDDGYTDVMENTLGTDPLDAEDYPPDNDGDGVPDTDDTDDDNDLTPDIKDDFPFNAAADTDTDGDGDPDELYLEDDSLTEDLDDDNDKVNDDLDAFPQNPAETNDTDGDGWGDNSDLDDDNDGWSDVIENAAGSDPFDEKSIPADIDEDKIPDYQDDDRDGDGYTDSIETQLGTDISDPLDKPDDQDNDGTPDQLDEDDDNDGAPDHVDFDSKNPKVQDDPDIIEIPGTRFKFSFGEFAAGIVVSVLVFLIGGLFVGRKKLYYRKLLHELDKIEDEVALEEFAKKVNKAIESENITVSHTLAIQEKLELTRKKLMVAGIGGGHLPPAIQSKLDEILEDSKISRSEMKDLRKAMTDAGMSEKDKRTVTKEMADLRREQMKEGEEDDSPPTEPDMAPAEDIEPPELVDPDIE